MFYIKQNSFIFKTSTFFILFFIALSGLDVHAADVVLTWDKPNDTRVTGYKVFYGLAESDFKSATKKTINSPEQTSCNIYGLEDGNTYGFAAKSFDKNGNESVFSEVIFYDVPETQDKSPSDDDTSDDADSGSSDSDEKNNGDDGSDDIENNINNGGGSSGGGCFIRLTSDLITCD